MRKFVLSVGMIVFVSQMSGCPPTPTEPSPLVGVWTLQFPPALEFTLTLNGDGTAMATLNGTLAWEVNGTEFVMRNTIGEAENIYVGRVIDNNTLEGAWMQCIGSNRGDGGEWDAVRQ